MIDPNNVTNPARTAGGAGGVPPLLRRRGRARTPTSRPRSWSGSSGAAGPSPTSARATGRARLEARLREVQPRQVLAPRPQLQGARRARAPTSGACTWEELTRFPGDRDQDRQVLRPPLAARRDARRAGHARARLDARALGARRRGGFAVPRHSPQDPRAYRFWETVYFGMVSARHHGPARAPRGLGQVRPRPLEGEARERRPS